MEMERLGKRNEELRIPSHRFKRRMRRESNHESWVAEDRMTVSRDGKLRNWVTPGLKTDTTFNRDTSSVVSVADIYI